MDWLVMVTDARLPDGTLLKDWQPVAQMPSVPRSAAVTKFLLKVVIMIGLINRVRLGRNS
jgi:hypothetical protein